MRLDATPMLGPCCRIDVLVRDLPAAPAEILRSIEAVHRAEARRQQREAQRLVLLPIPVGREAGEAAEARLALREPGSGRAALVAQRSEQQRGERDRTEEAVQRDQAAEVALRYERPDPEPGAAEAKHREREVEGRDLAHGESHRRPDREREQCEGRQQLGLLRAQVTFEHERAEEQDERDERRMGKRLGDARFGLAVSQPRKSERREQQHALRVARPPGDRGPGEALRVQEARCEQAGGADARRDHRRAERDRKDQPEDIAHAAQRRVKVAGAFEKPCARKRRERVARRDRCRGRERQPVQRVGRDAADDERRKVAQAHQRQRDQRKPRRRPDERNEVVNHRERQSPLHCAAVACGEEKALRGVAERALHHAPSFWCGGATLRISSKVVTPAATFIAPLMRRDFMPSL